MDLRRRARAAIARVRRGLGEGPLRLFDLLLAAGEAGLKLPNPGNASAYAGVRDPRRRLPTLDPRARDRDILTRRLAKVLPRERALRVLLAHAAGALAPDGRPPADPSLSFALDALVRLYARLYGSRVRRLGRVVDASRLARLLAETPRGRRRSSGRRPGPLGRELAVDPRFMKRLGRALGRRVEPGMEARYLYYTKAGDGFWPHPDDPMYAANALVCLERRGPSDGGRPSAFFVARPNGRFERIELKPGEGLVAEARGVIHGREPLRRGERVTLLSIELVYP